MLFIASPSMILFYAVIPLFSPYNDIAEKKKRERFDSGASQSWAFREQPFIVLERAVHPAQIKVTFPLTTLT